MKNPIILFLVLSVLIGGCAYSQDEKPYDTGTIKVTENDKNISFHIVWKNNANTQSNVNFPPYKFKNTRHKNQWLQIVKDEIMNNPDAFRVNWGYDVNISFPDPDADRKEEVPGMGGSILNDVLNLLKGDKLVQQDGKVCVNGFVEWTEVNLGFDETSLTPANHVSESEQKQKEAELKEKELAALKEARAGKTITTPLANGGSQTKTYDSDGNLKSEVIIGPGKVTNNGNGSTTIETEKIENDYDVDGNKIKGTKTSDKTTTTANGDIETTTTTEYYNNGVLTKKSTITDTMKSNGDQSTSDVSVDYDNEGNATGASIKTVGADGDFFNLDVNFNTGETSHSYGNKKKGYSGSFNMTTDGNNGGTNVALCLSPEMLNLMINWNRLGAAVTDPSPIDDEEIMSETLDTAPIDPPQYETDWTPDVKYLNILEGGGVTDPPKHED